MGRNRNSVLQPGPKVLQRNYSQNNYSQSFMPIFPQDFDTDDTLKYRVICFLEEVMHDPDLLTQERKAAANIIR